MFLLVALLFQIVNIIIYIYIFDYVIIIYYIYLYYTILLFYDVRVFEFYDLSGDRIETKTQKFNRSKCNLCFQILPC
jgi:hypothetical protein